MASTFTITLHRDDETEVTVEYSISGGCSAHMGSLTYAGHPEESPEVEIVDVFTESGSLKWTDAEDERWCQYILENHEDDGPDPDDERDRIAEDRAFYDSQPYGED
jgi:predicted dehydrogenase